MHCFTLPLKRSLTNLVTLHSSSQEESVKPLLVGSTAHKLVHYAAAAAPAELELSSRYPVNNWLAMAGEVVLLLRWLHYIQCSAHGNAN